MVPVVIVYKLSIRQLHTHGLHACWEDARVHSREPARAGPHLPIRRAGNAPPRRIGAGAAPASAPGRHPLTAPIHAREAIWNAFRHTAGRNLEAAFENADPATFAAIAEELRARRILYVAAARESHGVARYLHAIASLASPAFRLVGHDGGIQADDLFDIGKEDALICLAAGPAPEAVHNAALLASEHGALVVAIAHAPPAALAALADHVLAVPQHSASFFPSHLAMLAVAEMLVGFVMAGTEEAVTDRIERIRDTRQRTRPLGVRGYRKVRKSGAAQVLT